MLDAIDPAKIKEFETTVYNKLDTTYASTTEKILSEKKLTEEIEADMKKIIEESLSEVA